MALGIFAFAILSVLGLLSVALNTSKETQIDSSLTTLIRTLNSDVHSAVTTNAVNALLAGPRTFDFVGKPVPTNSADAFFRVTFTHANQGASAQSAVMHLLGLKQTTNMILWRAAISYPAPSYPSETVVLINNALY